MVMFLMPVRQSGVKGAVGLTAFPQSLFIPKTRTVSFLSPQRKSLLKAVANPSSYPVVTTFKLALFPFSATMTVQEPANIAVIWSWILTAFCQLWVVVSEESIPALIVRSSNTWLILAISPARIVFYVPRVIGNQISVILSNPLQSFQTIQERPVSPPGLFQQQRPLQAQPKTTASLTSVSGNGQMKTTFQLGEYPLFNSVLSKYASLLAFVEMSIFGSIAF